MGLLNESCPPLHSCLSEDKNGMTHAILEVVAGGIVQTAEDIHRYVRCTLLNSTKPFQDVVKSAQDSLRWLCHRKFLEWNEDTKLYSTTPLGRAAFGSSLCPEESLVQISTLYFYCCVFNFLSGISVSCSFEYSSVISFCAHQLIFFNFWIHPKSAVRKLRFVQVNDNIFLDFLDCAG